MAKKPTTSAPRTSFAEEANAGILENVIGFLNKYKNTLFIVVLILLIGTAALIIASQTKRSANEKANQIYESVINNMAAIARMTNTQKQMETFQQQINELNRLIANYPNTLPAVRASLFLGKAHYQDGLRTANQQSINSAYNYYASAVEKAPSDFYKVLGYMGMASCNELKNEYHSAIAKYQIITNLYADQGFNPVALIGIARNYEILNDVNNAISAYQTVVNNYPDSLWAKYARGKLYFFNESDTSAPLNPTPAPNQSPKPAVH